MSTDGTFSIAADPFASPASPIERVTSIASDQSLGRSSTTLVLGSVWLWLAWARNHNRPGGRHAGKIGRPPQRRGRPANGRIATLATGMGHGSIQADDRAVFFHCADLVGITFNDLVVGDAVSFEVIEDSVSGPGATHVGRSARVND
jgi:cold shock CspA family protein